MLVALCLNVLARFPDRIPRPARPVPASPALIDALDTDDPALCAVLAQLVHPLPPHLRDRDIHRAHPALPLLQRIPDAPDFSLVTLLAFPHCPLLRDDNAVRLCSLPRLVVLDLRGCTISHRALAALARALDASATTGPWRLRLISLHGCPNIADDAIPALSRFPLLSAVDLRFTRCSPSAVDASLSPLGFRPSHNNSLFHPAPLSVALCTLEKVALAAPDPISLFSCPLHSVFRLHVNGLDHSPSRPKKAVLRSMPCAEHTIVVLPPLTSRPSASTTTVPIERPAHSPAVSSFYAPASNSRSRKSILPLSAQAVQSSADPLAIARPPPPWSALDASRFPSASETSRRVLNDTLKVDRTRLHKRSSDAVADMAHQFARKRPKIESEFALARTQANAPIKPRNPFARSVFAENSSEPPAQLRACRSLPSKPLRPITTLKPPILPKELLPSLPRKAEPKQTRLAFARQG